MAQQAVPQKVVRETIPLWLAVAITVLVSMPFGLWLGKYNFALWVAFITWAEYFTLGAKPSAIKLILPSFAYSAALTAITLPPSALISRAVRSASSRFTSTIATAAPSSANARAAHFPMPLAPPVTYAFFPFKLNLSCSFILLYLSLIL